MTIALARARRSGRPRTAVRSASRSMCRRSSRTACAVPGQRSAEDAADLGEEQRPAVPAADVGLLVGERDAQLGVVEMRQRTRGHEQARAQQPGRGQHDAVAADDQAARGPEPERVAHQAPHRHRRLRDARQRVEQRQREREATDHGGEMPRHAVLRRARPLRDRREQLGRVQQEQRPADGAHDQHRAQAQPGAPQGARSGRISASESEDVRESDAQERRGDERREGHRMRSVATSSASRRRSSAWSVGQSADELGERDLASLGAWRCASCARSSATGSRPR